MTKQTTTNGRSGKADDQHQDLVSMASNGANLEAFVVATDSAIKGFTAINQEMMNFGQRRFEENVECSKALAECKSLEDAFTVQCEFIQTATQQYLEGSNHLLEAMTKVAESSWAPVQDRTKQVLHELAHE